MEEAKKLFKPAVKKGKSSWKPASITDVLDKEPGYRYRWCNKEIDNLSKKEIEGWEPISKITSDNTSLADSRFTDGKQLTSTRERHDMVLMRIPEDLALERDAYYSNETARRTQGLTAHLKKEIRDKGGNAQIHGDITISSKQGTQVIE